MEFSKIPSYGWIRRVGTTLAGILGSGIVLGVEEGQQRKNEQQRDKRRPTEQEMREDCGAEKEKAAQVMEVRSYCSGLADEEAEGLAHQKSRFVVEVRSSCSSLADEEAEDSAHQKSRSVVFE